MRSERDAEIVRRYRDERESIRDLAAAHGVTPQRIHQILQREGVVMRGQGRSGRRDLLAALQQAERERDAAVRHAMEMATMLQECYRPAGCQRHGGSPDPVVELYLRLAALPDDVRASTAESAR